MLKPLFSSLALAALALPAGAQAPALLPVLRPAFVAAPAAQVGVPVPPAPGLARRVLTLVRSSPAREAREQALLDATAALVESTREGRRILCELEAAGKTIPVSFAAEPGSVLSRGSGPESVDGTAGSWDRKTGRISLNELFLDMRDQPFAAASLAKTLAHEAEHARLSAAARLLGPTLADVMIIDAANERNAYLSGFLVAAELGVETAGMDSARAVAADPAGYWDRKRLADPLYAVSLTLDEMADPVAAWNKRLAALRERLAKDREELDSGMPWTRKALAHMEKAHGLQVAHLREELETDVLSMTATAQERQESIAAVERVIGMYDDPAMAAAFAQEFAAARGSAGYRAFTDQVAEKLARLARLLPPPPAPGAAAPSGKLTWTEFYERLEADRKAQPEHWDPVSRDPIGQGPSWKLVLAESSDSRG